MAPAVTGLMARPSSFGAAARARPPAMPPMPINGTLAAPAPRICDGFITIAAPLPSIPSAWATFSWARFSSGVIHSCWRCASW